MTSRKKGPWAIVSQSEIYDNPWIRVTHHDVTTPAGGDGLYGTVHFKNRAVGVVALDAQHHTYLVGQYRFALDRYSWEIPAGGGTADADPRDTAARELREEAGLIARQWRRLLDCDLSNSVTDERATAFLAWDLKQGTPSPDPTEQLTVRRLPLIEAFAMVARGEIRDVLSVAALQAVQLLFLENNLPSFDA